MKYLFSFLLLLPLVLSNFALGAEFTAGHMTVTDPWARATVDAAKVGGGYFIMRNHGKAPDRLVAVRSDVAGRIEIHEMRMENNVMKMRNLANGLEIGAQKTVALQPGGYHIMFFDPKAPFREGKSFRASLVFEKAGRLDVVFQIKPMKSKAVKEHDMRGHHAH